MDKDDIKFFCEIVGVLLALGIRIAVFMLPIALILRLAFGG